MYKLCVCKKNKFGHYIPVEVKDEKNRKDSMLSFKRYAYDGEQMRFKFYGTGKV